LRAETSPESLHYGSFTFVQGLDILKLTKTPLICTVMFHITVWRG